jgi:hypothetical protein
LESGIINLSHARIFHPLSPRSEVTPDFCPFVAHGLKEVISEHNHIYPITPVSFSGDSTGALDNPEIVIFSGEPAFKAPSHCIKIHKNSRN